MTDQNVSLTMPPDYKGARLDKALAELLPAHSRATIQKWLSDGRVRVDGAPVSRRFGIKGGEQVVVAVPPPLAEELPAQKINLDVVHRDDDLFVINKPAGLVVHPGAGQRDRTLLNALLHLDDGLRALPRGGIVHRLDKDTSGLLVVARNEAARRHLTAQLKARSVERRYLAVVHGVLIAGERIEQPIGRHHRDRLKFCVTATGKPAVTEVRVKEKFRAHTLINADLATGRTHQIRVHLAWRGHPVVGDKLYAGRMRVPPDADDALTATLQNFPRQALHATQLSLQHPTGGEWCEWEQPPPDDLQQLIDILEADVK